MRKELQEIVNKFKEFSDYVNGLDLSICNECSREELNKFVDEVRANEKKRYIILEVNEVIQKKKLEEYPELLGVYRFPVIKEMDFLSEEEQIKLDKYLGQQGRNYYFGSGSWRWRELVKTFKDEDAEEKILRVFLDKDMVRRTFEVYLCCDNIYIEEKELNNMIKYKELEDNCTTNEEWDLYYRLQDELEEYTYCDECDSDALSNITLNKLKEILNRPLRYSLYKLKVSASTKYDNV